jgi:ABC-type molybdate transport system substrate-binding protein
MAEMTGQQTSLAVLSTLALRGVLVEIGEEFRSTTGVAIAATYRSTNALLDMIAHGAAADMTILTREGIARLVREGLIAGDSTADLCQSGWALRSLPEQRSPISARSRRCGARSLKPSRSRFLARAQAGCISPK